MPFSIKCLGCEETFISLHNPETRKEGQKPKYCSVACRYGHKKNQSEARTSKVCSNCKQEKNRSEFHRKRLKSGTWSIVDLCKVCQKENQAKANVQYKKEYGISRKTQRRQESRSAYMNALLNGRKSRCSLSVSFLLTMFDDQEGKCALSGEQMTMIAGKGRPATNVSIDRIDPKQGYEPENVQLVCRVMNTMKTDLAMEEFRKWIAATARWQESKEVAEKSA